MTNEAALADQKRTSAKRGRATFNVKILPQRKPVHVIYFMQAENGLIKIGTTGYITERLASLRFQSPVGIELLATTSGKRADEHTYHRQFAEHRLHGEWFSPHPDILAEINRLCASHRPAR